MMTVGWALGASSELPGGGVPIRRQPVTVHPEGVTGPVAHREADDPERGPDRQEREHGEVGDCFHARDRTSRRPGPASPWCKDAAVILTVRVPGWVLEEDLHVLSVGDRVTSWLTFEEADRLALSADLVQVIHGTASPLPEWPGAEPQRHPTQVDFDGGAVYTQNRWTGVLVDLELTAD